MLKEVFRHKFLGAFIYLKKTAQGESKETYANSYFRLILFILSDLMKHS